VVVTERPASPGESDEESVALARTYARVGPYRTPLPAHP
jgi:hypothetical protein